MGARTGAATDRLRALERIYAHELWQRLLAIDEAIERRERGEPQPGDGKDLQAVVTGVAASAVAFGLGEVSRAADALGESLATEREESSRLPLREGIAGLRLAVAQSELADSLPALASTEPAARPKRLLLAFEEDPEVSGELGFQLGCFGFLVRVATDPRDFVASLSHAAAVILDVDVHASQGKVPQVISAVLRYRRDATEPPPLLVLSPRDDLETRLRAVRFGADAFLPRPADVRELVEQLDALVHHRSERPFRVLLVDDNYAEALPLLLALQTGGLDVEIATGAMDALRRLTEVDPDLVLANIDLLGCSGPELVAVIRQERAHADLPVVLLSSAGSSLRQQLDAIRRGADDLLPVPRSPEELLLTVRSHAQRHRLVRHFRTRDGLTGLLNFTSAMDALRLASRRASDEQRSLILALIDVDGLGRLNRQLGHLIGDSVLRGLADLLRQRFRRTDVLARYANRFLVMLPDTSMANAVRILEETRMLFGEIHHRNRERAFSVTFSSGVARQRPGDAPADLYQQARSALERARAFGGDRLETADQ